MITWVQAESKYPSESDWIIPMTSPPMAAPWMFPIPPNTAAVNATRPAENPRSNAMFVK